MARDTKPQVKLRFESEAEECARDKGIHYVVLRTQSRKTNLCRGGYGDNFVTNRRAVWTP